MKCPECENDNVLSEGDGILSCENCSLIFDSGPQWMKYKPSNNINQVNHTKSVAYTTNTVMEWQKSVRTNISIGKNIL